MFYDGHLLLIGHKIHPLLGVLKLDFVCVQEVNDMLHCGWLILCDLGKDVIQIILELFVILAILPIQKYGRLYAL